MQPKPAVVGDDSLTVAPHLARIAFLHVTPPNFVGGYERFVSHLSAELLKMSIGVDQVTVPSMPSRLAYRLTAGSTQHLSRARLTEHGESTWAQARERLNAADCVYVKNDPLDLAVAAFIARDKPLVVGIHSSLDFPSGGLRIRLRRALRHSLPYRRLLLGGRRLYHCLYPPPPSWGLPPELVRVVPHPIVRNWSQPRTASRDQRFLFVGRLAHEKGADLLCGLAERLRHQEFTELTVVGDGEYADQLRRQPGLQYHPYRDDVRQLMRNSSWLLLPSRWEQQPLVLLESIGEGLPYILGSAKDLQRYALRPGLVMRDATADSLFECCVLAIELGQNARDYRDTVGRVEAVAQAWPGPEETLRGLTSLLLEACSLGRR